MKTFVILVLALISTFPITAAAFFQSSPKDEITATITASTSEKELEDLVSFLEENELILTVKKQERNTESKLTGLSISLEGSNQKRQYTMSSNRPIADLELGSKDGTLFIQSGNNTMAGGWSDPFSSGNPGGAISSLMQQFGFDMQSAFNFDEEEDAAFMSGGLFDMQKLREEMMKAFNFEEANEIDEDPLTQKSPNNPTHGHKGLPKYSFIDNPGIDKLILIDGEEASFDTLDTLAKKDQLEVVDFLKPATAISLYGNKAKDGAIIATTRQ